MFFFSSRRRHTRYWRDWSSDVCSSDLTFCEGRRVGKTFRPYHGGPIDGPENGPPPAAWTIHCVPQGHFIDQKYDIPVPHTDDIRVRSFTSTELIYQLESSLGVE